MPIKHMAQELQQIAPTASESVDRRSWLPKFTDAVGKVATEAECTRVTASAALVWIGVLVHQARKANYAERRMSGLEARLLPYATFDTVIPHGQIAKPGSAHQAIEDLFLNRRRNEIAIRHESEFYCSFRLLTNRIN